MTANDSVAGGTGTNTLTVTSGTRIDDTGFTNVSAISAVKGNTGVALSVQLGAKAAAAGVTSLTAADSQAITVATTSTAYTGALTVNLAATANAVDNVDLSASAASLTVKGSDFAFQTTDVLKGGTGTADALEITASGATANLGSGVSGFESITIKPNATTASNTIGLNTNDANVASAATLVIDASALTDTAAVFTFNGSAEQDGKFSVTGGSANDVLQGGVAADTLVGGAGNDSLTGNAGSDSLVGGDGADTLTGGAGADTLAGGAGNDVFTYTAVSESQIGSYDTITDFTSGSDKLKLTALLGGTAGKFVGNANSDTAARLLLSGGSNANKEAVFNTTDKILYVDVNGDGVINASDLVVYLPNVSTLAVADLGSDYNDASNGAGLTKALTSSAVDTLAGGAGNDIFTVAFESHLQSGDSIDGGLGTDTLQLNNTGTFDLGGVNLTSSSIEVISSTVTTGTVVILDGSTNITGRTITVKAASTGDADVTLKTAGALLDLSSVTLSNIDTVTNTALQTTTFTLGAGSLSANIVSAGTNADTVASGATTPTGTWTLGDGLNQVNVSTGAVLNNTITVSGAGTAALTIASGNITLSAANNAIFTTGDITAAGTNTITINSASTSLTTDADIENYVLTGAGANTITLTGNQGVTTAVNASTQTINTFGTTVSAAMVGNSTATDVLNIVTNNTTLTSTLTSIDSITLASGVSATMTRAAAALITAAAGTNTVTISDVSLVITTNANVENYTLAGAGANTVTLTAAGQSVTTAVDASAQTINTGTLTSYTGTITGNATDTTTLAIGTSGTVISSAALNIGASSGVQVLAQGTNAVTISASQHASLITVSSTAAITGTGVITINTASTGITADASPTGYVLTGAGGGASTITLAAAGQNVTTAVDGSIQTINTGALTAYTGTITGNATDTTTLAIGSGNADVSGANLNIGVATGVEVLAQGTNAVTMTAAQHAALIGVSSITAITGTGTVTISTASTSIQADASPSAYVLAGAGANTITLAANQSVTTAVDLSTQTINTFGTSVSGTFTGNSTATDVLNITTTGTTLTSAVTSIDNITLANNVNAIMTSAAAALITAATGTNTVTLSDAASSLVLSPLVETYLFSNNANTATLGTAAGNLAQIITGGSSTDVLTLGAGAYTGTWSGGISGVTTVAGNTSVAGVNNGAAITGATLTTPSGANNISMTDTQYGAFTIAATAGVSDTITLTTAGTIAANSGVENYNLANGTNVFTLSTTAQAVVGGTGADTINVTLANNGAIATTANLGVDAVTDRVAITNTLLEAGVTSSSLLTVSNFNVANDAVTVINGVSSGALVGGTVSAAGFQALTAGSNTTVTALVKGVIEIQSSNIASFDDTDGGNAETAIIAALGIITDPGNASGGEYTMVLYSGANAGIYDVIVANTVTNVTLAANITIELVGVLSNVGADALTAANFY